MHERLIGEEVALDVPCNLESSAIVVEFVARLMEAGGGSPKEADRLRDEVREAIGSLCDGADGDDSGSEERRLQARLKITADGVDVLLASNRSGGEERCLRFSEA